MEQGRPHGAAARAVPGVPGQATASASHGTPDAGHVRGEHVHSQEIYGEEAYGMPTGPRPGAAADGPVGALSGPSAP
ncbi:hypothetical protein, partial [Streptomyces sp. UNOC14_S4]|uniref:hypothetical protein n=1 Tax=Streptomyces sp. UNOC14_S4 TaxID=2872340 RepID=UPI001E2F5D79